MAWRQRRVRQLVIPEALAALCSLELAHEAGWPSVIIIGDCLAVINDLNSRERCLTTAGPFIDEGRRLVSLFSSCSVSFVRRTFNTVAHDLASSCGLDADGTTVLPS